MSWRNIYESRCCTADEAVRRIKSGDRVVTGHACAEPQSLIAALIRNRESFEQVEIMHMLTLGPAHYCLPENDRHFIHHSLFTGPSTRPAINEGRARFTPCHFSQVPALMRDGLLPVDVAMCQLSPPDEHGYCSFGLSVDYTRPAVECARTVIAEISPHVPRTHGETFIHVSELDCIVTSDVRPYEYGRPEPTELDAAIAGHCAELIRDGDCLQLGIGAVPEAILGYLVHKKDLGVHTEMFSDGVVDLVEAGVINGARKNLHPRKLVSTFFMGSERLYRFVDDNPTVELYPVDYTNNPGVIARNDNMVAVNSALQVDVTGQVVADTIGYRQYSGSGGQADFVRGAAWSRGGRSIIALPSTARGGSVSRIVPHIDEGAAVVTNRTDVHYIVTEYGVASLRGKSLEERAGELINVAHPDFRDQLRFQYRKRLGCAA